MSANVSNSGFERQEETGEWLGRGKHLYAMDADLFFKLFSARDTGQSDLFAQATDGIPRDRVIDGVDQSDFLLGKQEKSNREGFIVYMGKDIFGIKWRNCTTASSASSRKPAWRSAC